MKPFCPYCRSGLDEPCQTVLCAACGSVHHSACWELNGCCSVYGCRNISIRSKIRWNLLPPAILAFALIPAAQNVFLFLLLPLILYTCAAIGSYVKGFHHA